jgi:hypothetical protein
MDDEPMASVSSYFHIDEPGFHDADLVLLATDAVFFYAHCSTLLKQSSNRFGNLIVERSDYRDDSKATVGQKKRTSSLRVVATDFQSDILELVLVVVYGFSVESLSVSTGTLLGAIPALLSLGYTLRDMIAPGSELFSAFLKAAEADSLSIYATAAQYSLELLAAAVSRLTIASQLGGISDQLAQQMGPIYLKRLFCTLLLYLAVPLFRTDKNAWRVVLHMERTRELRHLVLLPLNLHSPGVPAGVKCNEKVQKSVKQAWTTAAAYIVVQDDPSDIYDVIAPFIGRLECELCCQSLKEQMGMIIQGWDTMTSTV